MEVESGRQIIQKNIASGRLDGIRRLCLCNENLRMVRGSRKL